MIFEQVEILSKILRYQTERELIYALKFSKHSDCTILYYHSLKYSTINSSEKYVHDISLKVPKHFEKIYFMMPCIVIKHVLLPKNSHTFHHRIFSRPIFKISKYLRHITLETDFPQFLIYCKIAPKYTQTIFCTGNVCIDFIPKCVRKLKHASISSLKKLLLPKKLIYLSIWHRMKNQKPKLPKYLKYLYMYELNCIENDYVITSKYLNFLKIDGKYANVIIDNANCKINTLAISSLSPKIINLPNNLNSFVKTPESIMYTSSNVP